MEAATSVGMRPAQEDRVVICPYIGCKQTTLVGVFDGTVGDAASEYVHRNIINHTNTADVRFKHVTVSLFIHIYIYYSVFTFNSLYIYIYKNICIYGFYQIHIYSVSFCQNRVVVTSLMQK